MITKLWFTGPGNKHFTSHVYTEHMGNCCGGRVLYGIGSEEVFSEATNNRGYGWVLTLQDVAYLNAGLTLATMLYLHRGVYTLVDAVNGEHQWIDGTSMSLDLTQRITSGNIGRMGTFHAAATLRAALESGDPNHAVFATAFNCLFAGSARVSAGLGAEELRYGTGRYHQLFTSTSLPSFGEQVLNQVRLGGDVVNIKNPNSGNDLAMYNFTVNWY